ncbi:hypothetical protein C1645_827227 [Glomus cerebriforme]|uniref:Uncharacterized protein n=1 Tax=Glomus cerebriforme TaxID=658196 RepID=A0A397ST84_9GLOM|nr:hypothetical protein C1645_827227 [Glomus cerebriforme]
MKLYYIPLKEESTSYYSYFTPEYYFEPQWSVGMRDLIDKEELKKRIDGLNEIVKVNSLLSVKRLWGAFCAFLLCTALIVIITILVFFGSLLNFVVYDLLEFINRYVIGPIVAELILVFLLFLAIFVIINEAKSRTLKFTTEIEKKLYEYNEKNLNVHYKLKWRKGIFTRYDIELGCYINNGNIIFREKVPLMFGENAEIEIEINDKQRV